MNINEVPYQQQSRPGKLTAAFIIGLIGAGFELTVGILWIVGVYAIASILSSIPFFGNIIATIGTIIAAIFIIDGGIMLLLWIFAFQGKNWARITLLVFLFIDVVIQFFSFNLIDFILDIILLVLLSSKEVVDYCNASGQYMPNYAPYYEGDPTVTMEDSTSSAPPTIPQRRVTRAFGVLIAESGPLKGQTFKLAPGCNSVIGRAGDIALPQSDVSASREHARIRDENGKFVIYDMGSTNHTYVNGERVNRKVLLDNDKIKIGKTMFRFQWVKK